MQQAALDRRASPPARPTGAGGTSPSDKLSVVRRDRRSGPKNAPSANRSDGASSAARTFRSHEGLRARRRGELEHEDQRTPPRRGAP